MSVSFIKIKNTLTIKTCFHCVVPHWFRPLCIIVEAVDLDVFKKRANAAPKARLGKAFPSSYT